MINQKNIIKIVKAYLPKTEQETVERIATDIVKDAEIMIFSMIKRAVFEENDKTYRQEE